jgi:hypothetical protein
VAYDWWVYDVAETTNMLLRFRKSRSMPRRPDAWYRSTDRTKVLDNGQTAIVFELTTREECPPDYVVRQLD